MRENFKVFHLRNLEEVLGQAVIVEDLDLEEVVDFVEDVIASVCGEIKIK